MLIVALLLFASGLLGLALLQRKKHTFHTRVLIALAAGILLGTILHQFDPDIVKQANRFIGILGTIYVRLLRMMAIPLVFISILSAIVGQQSGKLLGKMAAIVLIVLLGTTAISATVGGLTAMAFGLSADSIAIGEQESKRIDYLNERAGELQTWDQTLVEIIPANPLYALTGQGPSAILSVVLFACLLGLALLGVRSYAAEQASLLERLIQAFNTLVVEVVMMILMITPFGIFSLMTTTIAGSDYQSVLLLGRFVLASYLAIFILFVVHGLILFFLGLSPRLYYKKSFEALSFAFTSRTSAGTMPLTVQTLQEKMGVSTGVSNLAASLSLSIGQNGCAGIYPAMLVVMVLPTVGKEMTLGFFLTMVLVVTLASIGIAGVGGGATFAGITVLSALGLPVWIAGVLIAVEPLIDMARTALNVSDGMVAALTTAKITDQIDLDIYRDPTREFTDKALKVRSR